MPPSNTLSGLMLMSSLLPSLPAIIVWLVGIALALATWRRHPRVSQTALVACALLLVHTVGTPIIISVWDPGPGGTTQQYHLMMGLFILVRLGFSTVGYVLLLLAVFGWRATPRFPAGPLGEPFAERTAVRPANLPGGETAIRPDGPRP